MAYFVFLLRVGKDNQTDWISACKRWQVGLESFHRVSQELGKQHECLMPGGNRWEQAKEATKHKFSLPQNFA